MFGLEKKPGALVVLLRGELDFWGVPVLEQATDPVPPPSRLILDLRLVEFIDSMGMSELLRLHARLADAGGSLECVVARGGRRSMMC